MSETERWLPSRNDLIAILTEAQSGEPLQDGPGQPAAFAERVLTAAVAQGVLQPRNVVTCVYCHEAYPPGTPTAGAAILRSRVRRHGDSARHMSLCRVKWQTHRVRAALVPTHCDGKLRDVLTYYGNGEIGPPPHIEYDERTVAERERALYEKAMHGE